MISLTYVAGNNLKYRASNLIVCASCSISSTQCMTGVKAVPLQSCSGPEGSRKLRFPDYMTTAQDGGKVVSLTHRQPLTQEMLLVLISVRGWVDPRAIVRSEGLYVNEKFQWHQLGFELATFWFVAQRLNHCATAVWSIFCNYLVTAVFSEKLYFSCNVCFDFLYKFYLKHFPFQEEIGEVSSWKPFGLHVNFPIFSFDFTSDVSSTDFNKSSKIKFHENSPNSEWLHADGPTNGLTAEKWDSKLKFW